MKKNAHWVVGTDEVGQPTLQWAVGGELIDIDTPDPDPLARTYNFLRRLDVDGLALAEDKATDDTSYDPYNTGTFSVSSLRPRPSGRP